MGKSKLSNDEIESICTQVRYLIDTYNNELRISSKKSNFYGIIKEDVKVLKKAYISFFKEYTEFCELMEEIYPSKCLSTLQNPDIVFSSVNETTIDIIVDKYKITKYSTDIRSIVIFNSLKYENVDDIVKYSFLQLLERRVTDN